MSVVMDEPFVPEPDFDIPAPAIPHSREAEEAVVGAVLINPDIYFEVSQVVSPQDFYIHRNRWIAEAFQELASAGIPVDLLTVSENLGRKNLLVEAGGAAYLTSLVNVVPSSLNAVSYAHIVRGMAERRRGINFANTIAADAYDLKKDFDLRSSAVKMIQSEGGKTQRVTTREAASKAIDRMISRPDYCVFSVPDLDKRAGGLFAEELNILAGYQGSGKSALVTQIERANADTGKRVLDCTLEMSPSQKWMRMSCSDLRVDMNQMRSGRVDVETQGAVSRHAAELAERYFDKIIMYEPPMNLGDILSSVMLERPNLVCIDHLRLISGKPDRMSASEWYNHCIRFLRQEVAKNRDCPTAVILLHQINRSAFRENRRPTMHDLAFAGEDDADGVHLLYRNLEEDAQNDVVPVEIITDKSRFGWTGTTEAHFHLLEQRFFGSAFNDPEEYNWQKYIGD